MDWPNFWTQLAGGLIGALVGGSAIAYFNGYYSEKGRRLATHEDIDNVVNELRLVTKETETIKARVGSEAWAWQAVWNQRRDLYAEALQTIVEYRKLLTSRVLDEAWQAEYGLMLSNLKRLLALSLIFCGADGHKAFSTFYEEITGLETLDGAGLIIHGFEVAVVKAARKDLGVNCE